MQTKKQVTRRRTIYLDEAGRKQTSKALSPTEEAAFYNFLSKMGFTALKTETVKQDS